mmetsp:Transcript_3808/g.5528  ORF Transcript_3808/g.5528 Transcript_3808/m.5528 type:complete len:254 (-) Transcript_3808:1275-2036(-)|eukprot:CAMPEP_0203770582 /NCGR_PEP_ID=MMETSP0099_2-20121227/2910_1 /ASSEMBLY_ACC=CAM_ASM_000209 /TAXON_ID=96639 /ORGANISM=" , Strain NY0313808BC1" /LENGTH=253 /DNA_ID=CAMNT_0050667773 /DNA_START=85 /DNA_END=846 /DNA_ORIENTATION=-
MSTGDSAEEEVAINEVLTAGQALIVVAIVVAVTLTYGYRWWKRTEEERLEESFLEYDFKLPNEEKEMFQKIIEMKPEDKQENIPQLRQWHGSLCQVLMQRVIKTIELHEKVHSDHRTLMVLYKRGVAVSTLPQVERAKEILEQEVQECGAIANQLQPNWAQEIFPQAYKLLGEIQAERAKKEAEEAKKRQEEIDAEQAAEVARLEEEIKEQERAQAEQELLAGEQKEKDLRKRAGSSSSKGKKNNKKEGKKAQ